MMNPYQEESTTQNIPIFVAEIQRNHSVSAPYNLNFYSIKALNYL